MTEPVVQVITPELLLGVVGTGLISVSDFNCVLHPRAVAPLQELAAAAKASGFNLQVASSYRDFARQLLIWNNKANGLRPVLDANGELVDVTLLNDKEKIFAILRWSALPGASRHHWGTDLDVYDTSRMDANYALQLTLAETQGDGPFAAFHYWLNAELMNCSRGFFRPFCDGVGAVAAEPWHLSYAPVANVYAAQMSEAIVRAQIQISDIALKETLLENLSEIYQRFIQPYCEKGKCIE